MEERDDHEQDHERERHATVLVDDEHAAEQGDRGTDEPEDRPDERRLHETGRSALTPEPDLGEHQADDHHECDEPADGIREEHPARSRIRSSVRFTVPVLPSTCSCAPLPRAGRRG